ncbi:MAG TPA: GNAT family N-acetyltransferase [Micromonosporaceae bacterium]
MTTITDLLSRLESCYDAIPRINGAAAEQVGEFALFLREGNGWPYYARPRLGATGFDPEDVAAVRARQRELGVPEAFEWVHENSPDLFDVAQAAGLQVLRAPLMVLAPDHLPAPDELAAPDTTLAILDPDQPDFADLLAVSGAVAHLGFANGGTQAGPAGPAERDAAVTPLDRAQVADAAAGIRAGHKAEAVASIPDLGLAARGAFQAAEGAAEIVGVATLPAARRRGLGAAVSAVLSQHALASGWELVFLSAASEDVARVYARIGFERIGTACIAEPALDR